MQGINQGKAGVAAHRANKCVELVAKPRKEGNQGHEGWLLSRAKEATRGMKGEKRLDLLNQRRMRQIEQQMKNYGR